MEESTTFTSMYAKVFKSMFDGTLRGRSDALLVFVNLLANADREGWVDKHFVAIGQETGLSVERVVAAILELETPDPQSRSQDLEGKRLERIDAHREWGWRIVNYGKYRKLRDEDERREYNRVKQAESRAERGFVEEKLDLQIPPHLMLPDFICTWSRWMAFRRGYRKPKSWGDMFREQLEWLGKMSIEDATESLQQSMRNGWQGLFEPKSKEAKQISPNVTAIENRRNLDRYEAALKSLRDRKPINGWPKGSKELAEIKTLKEEIEKLKTAMNLKA